ncbi:MAG: folate family ECF transporter S component [Clostridia bacterium]|nr:folate family ECF transporter S component [Clostridia bacterium]
MSSFIVIVGTILFIGGLFGVYSGAYEKGELAGKVRELFASAFKDPKVALIIIGACAAFVGFVLIVWGMVRARKNRKTKAGMNIRVMTVLAMLVAMEIVLNRFLSVNTAGWKIGFAFIPPIVAAILFGPIESAIVYALSDFIGAILFPIGTYHPGFTACAFVMGLVAGLFLNKRPLARFGIKKQWKKIRFFPNIIVPVVINCLVLGLLVNTLWVAQLYGSKTYSGWFLYRLPEYAIMVPVQLILIPVLLKLCSMLVKAGIVKGAADDAAAHLKEISRNESILGLERVTELLSLMGDPQENTPVIHVAGTNGKGSFAAMLASVLRAAGYKVGSFTSPAVMGVSDSFRINGVTVSNDVLDGALASIEPLAASMAERPTEFEVMTAAAYELFRTERCDIAIVECGLGGRGDSTNVIRSPLLSVITNVQLDHTDRLGRTLPEIAAHKAGIIKDGRPVLWGGGHNAAEEVIVKAAEAHNSKLVCTDLSRLTVRSMEIDGTGIGFRGMGEYKLSLIGSYQPENAANVLTAVEMLREEGLNISNEAIAIGLSNAKWHARFEVVSRDPLVIFDGSHNPDGVRLAAQSIADFVKGGRAVLLMGVMADKDYAKYPEMLRLAAAKVYTVKPANPRALAAEELAEVFRNAGIPAEAGETFEEGVRAAYDYARMHGLPLVGLGTLYMYKDFIEALGIKQ